MANCVFLIDNGLAVNKLRSILTASGKTDGVVSGWMVLRRRDLSMDITLVSCAHVLFHIAYCVHRRKNTLQAILISTVVLEAAGSLGIFCL
jgi:hypothetical protein